MFLPLSLVAAANRSVAHSSALILSFSQTEAVFALLIASVLCYSFHQKHVPNTHVEQKQQRHQVRIQKRMLSIITS